MNLFCTAVALSLFATAVNAQHQAERVQRTASFVVKAPIEKAFPLFGPVREKEWAAGWEPQIIYANHPEVEEHMIFKTPPRHDGESEYIWIVTQYQPRDYFIEYTVSTLQRVWFITVKCESQNDHTRVFVTYSYTGLTPDGNQMNKQALDRMYANNLKDWEEAINYFLSSGKRLE